MTAAKKSNKSVPYLNDGLGGGYARRGLRKNREKRWEYHFHWLAPLAKESFWYLGNELFNKNVEKFVEKAGLARVRAHTANTLRSLH
jgi:hypothetical protein